MSCTSFNYNRTIIAGEFIIEIDEQKKYGYFQHLELGEQVSGGLWFEDNNDESLRLVNFDGLFELPEIVMNALRVKGFDVSYIKLMLEQKPEKPVRDFDGSYL
jgi:hypothetical protein